MIRTYVKGLDALIREYDRKRDGIEDALDDGCREASEYLMDCIMDKFGNYQPGWEALKEDTITRKIKKGNASNARKPLVDYGDMMFSFDIQTRNRTRKHTVAVVSDDPKLVFHMYGVPSRNVPQRDPVRPTTKEQHDKCFKIITDIVSKAMLGR